ncbi:hypothetical protein [Maribacter sp.]
MKKGKKIGLSLNKKIISKFEKYNLIGGTSHEPSDFCVPSQFCAPTSGKPSCVE